MRYVAYSLLVLLYVAHTDVWFWNDSRLVLGLPIGFTYHLAWMVAVAGALWLAVQYAWPAELEEAAERAAASGHATAADGDDR